MDVTTNEEIVTEKSATFITNDIAMAAYLFYRKLSLKSAIRDQGSKFKFCFDDPDSQAEQMTIDFINSESREFDSSMRSLKSLCHTKNMNP